MLEYQIITEKHKGPFGLVREQEKIGLRISTGNSSVGLPLHSAAVLVYLDDSDTLSLKSVGDNRVRVEFEAEPQRYKPRVDAVLDSDHREMITGRRRLTIYAESDPTNRVILEAPKFEPLVLDSFQAGFMIGQDSRANAV